MMPVEAAMMCGLCVSEEVQYTAVGCCSPTVMKKRDETPPASYYLQVYLRRAFKRRKAPRGVRRGEPSSSLVINPQIGFGSAFVFLRFRNSRRF